MTDNVHYLHPPPTSIAQFLRVGSTGHRQLEHLLSAGKLPPTRFVIDAASYDKQSDLIKALQKARVEIVLDTNAAELSTIGRYGGKFQDAPWARADRPLEGEDFIAGTNCSVIEPIAHFAVARDRLERMQDVLGDLDQTLGDPPRPPECRMRPSGQPQSHSVCRRP